MQHLPLPANLHPVVIAQGDVLRLPLPDKSVDLVFCSPPYEAARTYGIGFNLRGQAWVDFAVAGFVECLRVCRGLVAWVVEGQTRNFRYSATPALLMADLHRRGVHLRKPPIYRRVGIPGSGGPDFLRNDYEFIVCAGPGGKLSWSSNTAMGHAPKWAPGGAMSNRHADGRRINAHLSKRDGFGFTSGSGRGRKANGDPKKPREFNGRTPSQTQRANGGDGNGSYVPPVKANPGNVITLNVGGGVMGDDLCHENEAPFAEALAEFFIRSFCPPAGIVLDPFSGSGTTAAVALTHGRRAIAIDIRESQCELTRRRVKAAQDLIDFSADLKNLRIAAQPRKASHG